jgi:sugar-specific transcriptional regulator TrmB
MQDSVYMHSLDEDISTINELGLSVTQAKVYLALAKAGKLTVQEASKLSGVARPHVYQALNKLEDAGLVIRIINNPLRFQAFPLEECVSILLQRRIKKTAKLQKQTMLLKQHFKTTQALGAPDIQLQFTLIPKRDAVYATANRMLQNVQERIDFLCLTRRMIAWLSNCLPIVEETLSRKVLFRVIMPSADPNTDVWEPIKMLDKYSNFKLKLIPEEPKFGFSVWDGKEILMTTSPVDSSTPATTLWSNNRGLVDLCQEHFCCLWEKAKKS